MSPNPILRVLSTIQRHRVQALLMGGQACVFYGAAEFSRDTDLAVLGDPVNLDRLKNALTELEAERVAVPAFELDFLRRGHAVHFRCHHPDVEGMRVDVMSTFREMDPFELLWSRRTTLSTPEGTTFDLLSLPDLVQAKKTQRDRDWPMVRRLLESHYFQNRDEPSEKQIEFWLGELRSPELLIEIAQAYPDATRRLVSSRSLLTQALEGSLEPLTRALAEEESQERERDRIYWEPLKRELEQLRRAERKNRRG